MTSRPDLVALIGGHWYDAVSSVLSREGRAGEAQELAEAARRVLDLDAEDFGTISAQFADRTWAQALADACFPLHPGAAKRGALRSLVPLYELMLEVLELRAARREPLQIVVTAHLIGEYLPLLAWESTLGHAGDPLLIATGLGERWGSGERLCPHNAAQRSTAKRSRNACAGDVPGYTAYLDRFHSRLGATLAVCAMNHATIGAGERPDVGTTCPAPCGWAIAGSLDERRDLDARVRLALLYQDSALVALRHHAPVGHFFGVPSAAEIRDAWTSTWARLVSPWPDGSNPLPGVSRPADASEALPGMAAVVSAVAGRPMRPGRLIRSIGDDLAASAA